jgi:hypothetical protein
MSQWITRPRSDLSIADGHLESSLAAVDGITWKAAIDFGQVAFVIYR